MVTFTTKTRSDKDLECFNGEKLQNTNKYLKLGKPPGPGQIPNEVISTVIDEWPELILHTFNGILQIGVFLKRWKGRI